jgi:hypothetical protein
MNTLSEVIAEKPAATEPQRMTSIREAADSRVASRVYSVRDEQIQSLVQQLFFRQDPAPVRHVGFAAVETQTETAQLCLDVAMALAETGSHDVGLIDVRLQSVPLHIQLQIPADNPTDTTWQIAPRLWLAPRRSWPDDSPRGSGTTVLDDYARPHWNSIFPFCALIPFPGSRPRSPRTATAW